MGSVGHLAMGQHWPLTRFQPWSRHSRLMIFIFNVACFMLISYLGGQERLYCSDERLDIAYDNPSLFCQISGMDR